MLPALQNQRTRGHTEIVGQSKHINCRTHPSNILCSVKIYIVCGQYITDVLLENLIYFIYSKRPTRIFNIDGNSVIYTNTASSQLMLKRVQLFKHCIPEPLPRWPSGCKRDCRARGLESIPRSLTSSTESGNAPVYGNRLAHRKIK